MRKDLYTSGSVDLPKISKGRSYFDLSHSSHIDMNIGMLYPIDQVIQIVPGDTFDYKHRLNIRMTNPPKTPTMDQLVFDIYFFYVPHRIVWDNFDKFITNYSDDFYSGNNLTVPTIPLTGASNTVLTDLNHSIFDYLGYNAAGVVGAGSSNNKPLLNPNALPIRSYYLTWNEYFRYETLQTPVDIYKGDSEITTNMITATSGDTYYMATCNPATYWNTYHSKRYQAFCVMPVNRLPGYFSRALPEPLAGDDVSIINDIYLYNPLFKMDNVGQADPSDFANASGSYSDFAMSNGRLQIDGDDILAIQATGLPSLSNNIRSLSQAFSLNKFLYIDNVYGKRLTEFTYGHYGVNVPDERVQRPEFLAKRRIYLNINQVVQSSATDTTSPQGNAGAWSQTFDQAKDFVKSFVEFGSLLTLGCIRVLNHTFAQGIDKLWTQRSRLDFMFPEFVNTGDQPLYLRELYGTSNSPVSVFGYQERYAELKFIPSRVAGYMRPQVSNSLALWTYTDYYLTSPALSAQWMFEPHNNFNNTIYIADTTAPSFILDYVADIGAYRTLPYHSVPGELTGNW